MSMVLILEGGVAGLPSIPGLQQSVLVSPTTLFMMLLDGGDTVVSL